MIIAIHINVVDIVIGFVIFSFFLNKKKKGDGNNKLSKLDSIFKATLVIGSNNNVNTNKSVNVKK